jgi:hypothetical protein
MIHRFTRDERETAIDHAGDRLAYVILAFGVLLAVAYRSFALGESSWDLLALVIVSGAVSVLYRVRHQVLTRELLLVIGVSFVLAVVMAVGLAVGVAR